MAATLDKTKHGRIVQLLLRKLIDDMRQILFLLLIAPIVAWAQTDANEEIYRLEEKLARVQEETQAAFQRFQMTQEMRRMDMQSAPLSVPPSQAGKSGPAPEYEDFIEGEQEKHERIQQYSADLDRLYQHYRELEEERKSIIAEIDQLKQSQNPIQEE